MTFPGLIKIKILIIFILFFITKFRLRAAVTAYVNWGVFLETFFAIKIRFKNKIPITRQMLAEVKTIRTDLKGQKDPGLLSQTSF